MAYLLSQCHVTYALQETRHFFLIEKTNEFNAVGIFHVSFIVFHVAFPGRTFELF